MARQDPAEVASPSLFLLLSELRVGAELAQPGRALALDGAAWTGMVSAARAELLIGALRAHGRRPLEELVARFPTRSVADLPGSRPDLVAVHERNPCTGQTDLHPALVALPVQGDGVLRAREFESRANRGHRRTDPTRHRVATAGQPATDDLTAEVGDDRTNASAEYIHTDDKR